MRKNIFDQIAKYSKEYLDNLNKENIGVTLSVEELKKNIDYTLPDKGEGSDVVMKKLIDGSETRTNS